MVASSCGPHIVARTAAAVTNGSGTSQERFRIDVDAPRQARRVAEDCDWVIASKHDVEPPAVVAARDVRGSRPGDGHVPSEATSRAFAEPSDHLLSGPLR